MRGPGPDTTEVLTLSGHLDGRCTVELRALLTDHLARHGDADLRLDMGAVESVDLTVLRMLAAVSMRLRRDGHQLVLVGCTPGVRRLLSHGVWRRLLVVQRAVPAEPPEQSER